MTKGRIRLPINGEKISGKMERNITDNHFVLERCRVIMTLRFGRIIGVFLLSATALTAIASAPLLLRTTLPLAQSPVTDRYDSPSSSGESLPFFLATRLLFRLAFPQMRRIRSFSALPAEE